MKTKQFLYFELFDLFKDQGQWVIVTLFQYIYIQIWSK